MERFKKNFDDLKEGKLSEDKDIDFHLKENLKRIAILTVFFVSSYFIHRYLLNFIYEI